MTEASSTPSTQWRPTARILGYGGLIPFLAPTAWIAIAGHDGAWGTLALDALIAYAAVILSFIGGIQWGRRVFSAPPHHPAAPWQLVGSVIPSLIGWGAWLLPIVPGLLVLIVGFLGTFVWDWRLPASRWYLGLRAQLSGVAMVCLGVTAAQLV